jgi:lipopolysaccharide export LptBFGC system permease protein LptF
MNLITKYLLQKFIINITIAVIVCTILLLLIQALRFTDIVIIKGLPFKLLMYLIYLNVQPAWVEIIPFITLIAVVFTWLSLMQSNELIAMQSFGISNAKLSANILFIALFFSFINFILLSFVIPNSLIQYFNVKNKIDNSYTLENIEPGRFNQLSDTFILYVQNIKSNNLENIIIKNKTNNVITLFAKSGNLDTQNTSIVLNLNDVYIKEEGSQLNSTSFIVVDTYSINLSKNNNTVIKKTEPREFNIIDLFNYKNLNIIKSFNNDIYEVIKFQRKVFAEIVKRFINTLIPTLFLLISVYFLINNNFSRISNNFIALKILLIAILTKIILIFVLNIASIFYILLFVATIIPIIIIAYLLIKIFFKNFTLIKK